MWNKDAPSDGGMLRKADEASLLRILALAPWLACCQNPPL